MAGAYNLTKLAGFFKINIEGKEFQRRMEIRDAERIFGDGQVGGREADRKGAKVGFWSSVVYMGGGEGKNQGEMGGKRGIRICLILCCIKK